VPHAQKNLPSVLWKHRPATWVRAHLLTSPPDTAPCINQYDSLLLEHGLPVRVNDGAELRRSYGTTRRIAERDQSRGVRCAGTS
jgi:hypothetical protein